MATDSAPCPQPNNLVLYFLMYQQFRPQSVEPLDISSDRPVGFSFEEPSGSLAAFFIFDSISHLWSLTVSYLYPLMPTFLVIFYRHFDAYSRSFPC